MKPTTPAPFIDLNFDGGEGFDDEAIAPYVTTIHIAAGGHTGDAESIRRALSIAARFHLAIGAHPSYPDREGFGRRRISASVEEIAEFVSSQVALVCLLAREQGQAVTQVKPHGALYHAAASDKDVARAIAQSIQATDAHLVVVGPPDSKLLEQAKALGLATRAEGFVDRRYRNQSGKPVLVPRSDPNALLTDPEAAAEQAVSIARRSEVRTAEGITLPLRVETLCLHGDTPGAASVAQRVSGRLQDACVPRSRD